MKVKNKIGWSILAAILLVLFFNMPLTTRQGVNYKVQVIKIPLYIKVFEFIERDYWYGRLAKEITANFTRDEEKVMAILAWVVKNIHKVPDGFDIFDDHTLNIITRRYGTEDQLSDVFTTLCVYAGIPAFFRFESLRDGTRRMTLSYVLLDGKWRVFDVYRNTFFLNKDGEIAAIDDIIADPAIGRGKEAPSSGLTYEDFFKTLKPIEKDIISKPQRQVPMLRIRYEIMRLFNRFCTHKIPPQ